MVATIEVVVVMVMRMVLESVGSHDMQWYAGDWLAVSYEVVQSPLTTNTKFTGSSGVRWR